MKKILRVTGLIILVLFTCSIIALAAASVDNSTTTQIKVIKKPDVSLVKGSITITTPVKDQIFDERWGYTKKLEWQYSGFLKGKTLDGTKVKINLYKGGKFVRTIADDITIGGNNNGSFYWTITQDIIWGKDYQIEVISLEDQTIRTKSDMFTITYIVT